MDGWINKVNKGKLKQFISHRHVQNQSLGLSQAHPHRGKQQSRKEGEEGNKSRVYGVSMDR